MYEKAETDEERTERLTESAVFYLRRALSLVEIDELVGALFDARAAVEQLTLLRNHLAGRDT